VTRGKHAARAAAVRARAENDEVRRLVAELKAARDEIATLRRTLQQRPTAEDVAAALSRAAEDRKIADAMTARARGLAAQLDTADRHATVLADHIARMVGRRFEKETGYSPTADIWAVLLERKAVRATRDLRRLSPNDFQSMLNKHGVPVA
jgi:nuclear transport factor 2 (NTF2) superfamily protein